MSPPPLILHLGLFASVLAPPPERRDAMQSTGVRVRVRVCRGVGPRATRTQPNLWWCVTIPSPPGRPEASWPAPPVYCTCRHHLHRTLSPQLALSAQRLSLPGVPWQSKTDAELPRPPLPRPLNLARPGLAVPHYHYHRRHHLSVLFCLPPHPHRHRNIVPPLP